MMYKKNPDGVLKFSTTSKGKRFSKGWIMIDGKSHDIEVYMKNNQGFVIYLSDKQKEDSQMYFS